MTDGTYISVGNRLKKLVDIGDEMFAEVTSLPILTPAAWVPSAAFNARIYADVEIQVIGTPTTPYIFQDSFDGIAFNDCNIWDRTGVSLNAIATVGRFRLPGGCYLKARQGAGSTLMIRAGG